MAGPPSMYVTNLSPWAAIYERFEARIAGSVLTALPARVLTFDPIRQEAKVEIMIMGEQVTRDRNSTPRTSRTSLPFVPLMRVPVFVSGGAAFTIDVQVNPGDSGLVVFSKKSIDQWQITDVAEGPSPPPHQGEFEYGDAFFIPGFRPTPNAIKQFSNNGITLRDKDRENYIHLTDLGNIDTQAQLTGETSVTSHTITAPETVITAETSVNITSPAVTITSDLVTIGSGKTMAFGETAAFGGYVLSKIGAGDAATDAATYGQLHFHTTLTTPPSYRAFTDSTVVPLTSHGVFVPTPVWADLWFAINGTLGHSVIMGGSLHTTLYGDDPFEDFSMALVGTHALSVTLSGNATMLWSAAANTQDGEMIFNDNETVTTVLSAGGHIVADTIKVLGINFVAERTGNLTGGHLTLFHNGTSWEVNSVLHSGGVPNEDLAFSADSNGAGGITLTVTGTGAGLETRLTYSIAKPLGAHT
jgi:hypothetical protein